MAVETDLDHTHVLVSTPPRCSPAQMADVREGDTSRYLREQFADLKRVCRRKLLWSQADYVRTVGHMSAEIIRHHMEDCHGR